MLAVVAGQTYGQVNVDSSPGSVYSWTWGKVYDLQDPLSAYLFINMELNPLYTKENGQNTHIEKCVQEDI